MKKIEIWYMVQNGGDGSAYPTFYLTEKDTEEINQWDEDNGYDGFAELCNGMVETYEDSNIHQKAVKNSEAWARQKEAMK